MIFEAWVYFSGCKTQEQMTQPGSDLGSDFILTWKHCSIGQLGIFSKLHHASTPAWLASQAVQEVCRQWLHWELEWEDGKQEGQSGWEDAPASES